MRSARHCWPSASVRNASWPRPAPVSMAWRLLRRAPGLACRARSTWGRSTWSARRRTSAACSCSVPKWCPSRAATRHCAPPSTRPCGTGSRIRTAPYYLLGSAVGPHPYPYLVREFQRVIGIEARAQMLAQAGTLPDVVVACVGGGSNAIGLFHPFVADTGVKLLGFEAGGTGAGLGQNAASLAYGTPGVLQGCYSLLLQDEHGQIQETHSVSAGLDYPGVGPEHALLASIGRLDYAAAEDDESLEALAECCQSEGILPAIETAHALAGARRYAQKNPGCRILIGLSGRGDKDMPTLQRTLAAGEDPDDEQHTAARHDQRGHCRNSRPGSSCNRRVHDSRIPEPRGFREHLTAIAAAADVVEIGVPFSDPMADGATIQRASFAALQDGFTLPWLLQELEQMQPRPRAPLLLMSYLNPLLAFGLERLPEAAARAGVARFHHSRPAIRGKQRNARGTRSCRHCARADGHAGDAATAARNALQGQPGFRLRGDDDRHHGQVRGRARYRARLHGPRARRFTCAGLCGLRHPAGRAGRTNARTRRWRGGRLGAGRSARTRRRSCCVPALDCAAPDASSKPDPAARETSPA